ncbi:MAG TPA: hypothetical protein VGG14_04270 [Candidatus Sulfotelmatobacter sp.]|jgi:hypothetical protein
MHAARNVTISAPVEMSEPVRNSAWNNASAFADLKKFERALLVLCLGLGAAQIWISRYALGSDGVSYLDVGDAFFRGQWAQAINGYWSPLYAWCEGIALGLVKPSLWWEPITVHAVNFVIYVLSLFSFRFLLHSVLRSLRDDSADSSGEYVPLSQWILTGLGYCIFLWATIELIDVSYITPDLMVAMFIFLLGGYLVELRGSESLGRFALFGVICGTAYWSKAVMFPVSFALLAILLFSGALSKRRVLGVLLAGVTFLGVSAPLIAALTAQKGRLTFGDSGKLNYAFGVEPGISQKNWQGEPPGGGVPKHTTRQVLDRPPTFEFAEPIGGTYPPWFDPSYWDEGAHGTWRLRSQIRVLVQSARNYSKMLIAQLGLLTGIGIFLLWGRAPARRAILENWPLILAGCVSIGLYSLVLVRSRYVAGSFVLVFMGILGGIRLPREAQRTPLTKYIAAAVMGSILFSVFVFLAEAAYITNTVYDYPTDKDYVRAAEGLRNMGLHAGEKVAIIGDGDVQYWARLGKFKIVAEVFAPDAERMPFWSETWERRRMAYECFRKAGAKAAVVWSPPASVDPGWERVGNTNYYVRFLTR